MAKRTCQDCGAALKGHGTPIRCLSCAAKAKYIAKHGKPAKKIIAKCEVCDKEFVDYASNRQKQKHGVLFCSAECRAAWTGVHNSISRGGDGGGRAKKDKDVLFYRERSEVIRQKRREYYQANRDTILAKLREKSLCLKKEVMAHYGGRCACCGESNIEFLTIDHANGDGRLHRAVVGKGKLMYADIKRRGFPDDQGYRVLCLNCNTSLGFNGYCPHDKAMRQIVDKTPGKHTGRKGRPRTVA